MIETLANLQPLVLILMLIGMYGIENIIPYLEKPKNKKRYYKRNFIITLISFVINGLLGVMVVLVVELTAKNQWGLLNFLKLPEWATIIVGVLLIDFGSYVTHNIQHKAPFLWRFHRIHHSDPNLTVSSSLRFHPVDVIVAQFIYQSIGVAVFGISITSFVIYGTIALPLLILQHSNVKIPNWIEKYGRLIFATPGWHKIHHSAEQKQTDSHYGDVFTFWDRIFGTWSPVQPHEIRYGLDEFNEDRHHKIGYLMLSPFKKQKP